MEPEVERHRGSLLILGCVVAGIIVVLLASSFVYIFIRVWAEEAELAAQYGRSANPVKILSPYFLLGLMPIVGLLGCSLSIRWYWKTGSEAFRAPLRGGYLIWSLGMTSPLSFAWLNGFEALGMYSGDEPPITLVFSSFGACVLFVYIGTALMLGHMMRWYFAAGTGALALALQIVPLFLYWLWIFKIAFDTSITI